MKLIDSFRYALAGIRYGWREHRNFRIHCLACLSVLALGFYLGISTWEWMAVVLACGLVLCSELLNSSLETLSDAVTREQNELIGRAKDIAAAGVLVASLAAAATGIIVFGSHFLSILKPVN